MNRIDPELFAACFSSWEAECWPDKPDLVAIDGKGLLIFNYPHFFCSESGAQCDVGEAR